MKNLLLLSLVTIFSLVSLAQEVKIAPIVGLNGSYPGLSKATQNDYSNALYQAAGIRGTTVFMPVIRAQTGALLEYSPNDWLSFQTGLLMNLRGAKMVTKFSSVWGTSVTGKLSAKTNITYLEIPLLVGVGLGKSGVKVRIGPSIGVAVSAKSFVLITGGGESDTNSEKLNIGNDPLVDTVKPFDVSANLNIAKQWSVGEQILELSINLQPSLSNWVPIPANSSDYYGRHITVGIRAAYFFAVK
ncbi:outer membrane beta-barrel protein [Runella sp.]|uniref:outer membrane beta-barrel protein n=1 Tax=Runella sp. TaxID=1960881 RepID=UPI00261B36DE|nr:outer membrane beta-barrel protein [Runella sp.]